MLGNFEIKQKIVVLLGPPGSGKGSLSKLLVHELGWIQLSTGNLCRYHIAQQTALGKEIDLIISSGKLINDDLVSAMVAEWLGEQDPSRVVLLDGYPRTAEQARHLMGIVSGGHSTLSFFNFSVPDDVIVERLAHRVVCSNKSCQAVYSTLLLSNQSSQSSNICDVCGAALVRRTDDESVAVLERLRIYHSHAAELEDFIKQAGFLVLEVDGNKPLASVYQEFLRLLNHSNV